MFRYNGSSVRFADVEFESDDGCACLVARRHAVSLVLYPREFALGKGVLVDESAKAGFVAVLYVASFDAAVGLGALVLAADRNGAELAGAQEACECRCGEEGACRHAEFAFFGVVFADVGHVDGFAAASANGAYEM